MNPLIVTGGEYLLSFVGQTLLSKGIHKTSKTIYGSLSNIFQFNCKKLTAIMQELDLFSKIKQIESLLNDYKNTPDFKKSETLDNAKQDLHDIIEKIKFEIMEIQIVLERHKKKYFNKYRKPNYSNSIDKIIQYSKIMDKRVDLFIQLLQLQPLSNNRNNSKKKQIKKEVEIFEDDFELI